MKQLILLALTASVLVSCATRKNKTLQESKSSSEVKVSSDIQSSSVKNDKGVTVSSSVIETVEEKPRVKQSVTVPLRSGTTINKDSLGNEIKVTLDSLHKVLTVDIDFNGGYKKTVQSGVITDNRDTKEVVSTVSSKDSTRVDKEYDKNEQIVTKKSPSIKFWFFIVVLGVLAVWLLKKRVF